MLPTPPRTSLNAPAIIRLLTRLGQPDVPRTALPLPDRLSEWVGWTDAIALSSVLAAPVPAAVAGLRTQGGDEAARCLELRSALSKAIANDALLAPARAPRHGRPGGGFAPPPPQAARLPDLAGPDADFALYRQCCLGLQQKMESDIGDLRAKLRGRLAAQSPALARLAALDATMERALAARERSLFGAVAGLLGQYFERLRAAAKAEAAEAAARAEAEAEAQVAAEAEATAAAAPDAGGSVGSADATGTPETAANAAANTTNAASTQNAAPAAAVRPRVAPGPAPADTWLDTFRKDMQSVLLAELDVRFQPVGGLLAALRAR
ncbi:MAG: DUF3348 family protein [Burkholderia gladioli]